MNTLEDIKVKVNEIMADEIKGKSFVVRAKKEQVLKSLNQWILKKLLVDICLL